MVLLNDRTKIAPCIGEPEGVGSVMNQVGDKGKLYVRIDSIAYLCRQGLPAEAG